MMYLEHYGLTEAPFRITPHTEFFFAGGNRGSTLEALIYAITHDEGIVKVSGEVGSGKTMLCRMLLERLPDNVETVYLANPSLSRDEILHSIADELGLPQPDERRLLLLRALQERLIELYAAGRQVVVLIDEAHAMPAESLEEIRLLSNLESNRHKLLKIVLFGQTELDDRLAQNEMRQLKERITHNFALEPLKRDDVAAYLMFRMHAAGYRGPALFTKAAIQIISRSSEGLTRRINILADKALLSAFSRGMHRIDRHEARAAVRDAQFRPMADGMAPIAIWIGTAAGLTLAAVVVAFLLYRMDDRDMPAPPRIADPTPPHIANPTTPPPSAIVPAASIAPQPPPQAAAMAAAMPTGGKLGPLTSARLAASESWLKKTPGSRHFIQLLNVDAGNAQSVESFLAKHAATLDEQQLRVYRSSLSGRDRIGVIYGEFATRDQATAAIGQLPEALRNESLHVRSVARLR